MEILVYSVMHCDAQGDSTDDANSLNFYQIYFKRNFTLLSR